MATYLTEQQINAKLVTLVQKVDTNFAKKKDAITKIELLDLVVPLPSGVTDEGKYIVVTYVNHVDGTNEHKEYIKLEVGSESGTGEGLTTEQAQQLTTAYEHSQTPHVSADDIPTNISDLTNDSGFITSIPEEYITETELETKGYLTEHQSLTDYAKKTDIPDVSDFLTEVPAEYVTDTKLSTELDKKVNKEVGKGLSTNDLTNELVTKINSSATEAFVTNAIANAQLGDKEVDLSGYATVDALKLKADLTHTHDQYLTKVPDEYITETELTDKNYADKTYVTQAVSNVKVDLTGYAKTSDIPTKVSQLTNDKGYLSSVPSEYVTEEKLNAKGYLTEHQDISNLALKSEIPDVSSFITSDDLPTVPTKVSDLANDSNFITSIPEEYITETELKSNYYTKEEVGELLEEGGSGVYSTTTPVNNPIGGIKRGDEFTNKPISEIIDLMLHVVERVKVALSSSVSGGIREIGDTSISTSTFTINVTKGTNPVVAVKLFKDNVEIQDFADVENGGSFTYDGGAITTNTKFEAKANDGDGDVASTAISYKFVLPMYIGSSDNGLEAFSETDATSLTKKIVDKNTKTIQAFTHTQQHMCFIVPNTWNGSPTIKDQNNFDITTAFNSKAIQVTGLDGVARDYIAFVSNDKSTLSNYSITISF